MLSFCIYLAGLWEKISLPLCLLLPTPHQVFQYVLSGQVYTFYEGRGGGEINNEHLLIDYNLNKMSSKASDPVHMLLFI